MFFYTYIHYDGDGATVPPEIDENLVNNLNIEINGHIKSEEILPCVKNLKNEKACGDDIIRNENQIECR
jgi:hypothetical protein